MVAKTPGLHDLAIPHLNGTKRFVRFGNLSHKQDDALILCNLFYILANTVMKSSSFIYKILCGAWRYDHHFLATELIPALEHLKTVGNRLFLFRCVLVVQRLYCLIMSHLESARKQHKAVFCVILQLFTHIREASLRSFFCRMASCQSSIPL